MHTLRCPKASGSRPCPPDCVEEEDFFSEVQLPLNGVLTAGFSGHDPHRMMRMYGLHEGSLFDWPKVRPSTRGSVSLQPAVTTDRPGTRWRGGVSFVLRPGWRAADGC